MTHGGPDGEKFAAQSEGGFSPLTGISTSGVSARKCKGLAASVSARLGLGSLRRKQVHFLNFRGPAAICVAARCLK